MGMNGTDVLLLVNTGTPTVPVYEVVGSQRDVTFEKTTEEVNFNSKDSRFTRVGAGRDKQTLSLEALYVPDNDAYLALEAAREDGELILVAKQVEGVTVATAQALITSLSEQFPDQAEATISIAMTIDGTWTEVGS